MMEDKRPLFLLEEKLTSKLIGIFIEISKENGFSYKEYIYQRLLSNKFLKDKIKFVSQPKIPLYCVTDGEYLGNYYPDFLIEGKIIIEVKAQGQIFNNHINQLIRYLSSTEYEIGLIVNFGTPKAQFIRRIFTNDRKAFITQLRTDDPRKPTGLPTEPH